MEQNILVLGFDEDSTAYQAFSVLKQSAAQDRLGLEEGMVVERDVRGMLHIREQVSAAAGMPGAALGGLLGAVIGLLGGPLGVLLGGTTGLLFGSASDCDRADYEQCLMAQMAEMIPAGTTGVIALVNESSEEVVNGDMRQFDAVILRSPVSDAQAELSAHAEAAKAAEHAARKIPRAQHVKARHTKFDNWRVSQKHRLSGLSDRIMHAFARAST